MRESPLFEVRLRRFGIWRAGVGALAALALASTGARTLAVAPSADDSRWVLGTIVVALALVRAPTATLSTGVGQGEYRTGPEWSAALTVALDLGSFLLLRLDVGRRRHLWLPVPRGGLEREWHALRCALYSTPSASPVLAHARTPSSE